MEDISVVFSFTRPSVVTINVLFGGIWVALNCGKSYFSRRRQHFSLTLHIVRMTIHKHLGSSSVVGYVRSRLNITFKVLAKSSAAICMQLCCHLSSIGPLCPGSGPFRVKRLVYECLVHLKFSYCCVKPKVLLPVLFLWVPGSVTPGYGTTAYAWQ